MKSELPHYFVNGALFIMYGEAYDYCIDNNIPISSIIKSYEY